MNPLLRTCTALILVMLLSGTVDGGAHGLASSSVASGWYTIYPLRPQPLFHQGNGIGVDGKHNVYVADLLEGRELRFSPGGKVIASWSLGPPSLIHIWNPSVLAVDTFGNSYVLHDGITRYSPTGRSLVHWEVGLTAVSLAVGGSGNVFVLSYDAVAGGKGGAGRVDKFSPTGRLLTTWRTPVQADLVVKPDGLAVDPRGNVYVSMATTDDCYKACIVSTSVLYRFSPTGEITWTFRPNGIVFGPVSAVDGAGTVYYLPHGTNYESMDVYTLSSDGRQTARWSRAGGEPLGDTLHVALGGGRVYLSDSHLANVALYGASGVIRTLTPGGKQVSRWGAFVRSTSIPLWLGVAVGPNGNVYVTGGPNNAVYTVLSPTGTVLRQVGVSRTSNPIAPNPRSLRVDAAGNVYVLQGVGGTLLKYSPSGTLLARWSLPGAPTSGADDLALDRVGNIYVTAPSVIFKLSPQGVLLQRIGGPGSGPARFGGPGGIALDAQGNIYLADTYNNRVQKLAPDGRPILVFGNKQRFDRPIRIALAPNGEIYVVDLTHDVIQRFSPDGTFLGVMGEPGIGPGQFNEPVSIAFDAGGTLYVNDTANDRIQRYVPK